MTFERLLITMLQIHNYEKTSTTTYTQGSIRHIVDINNEPKRQKQLLVIIFFI